VPADAGKACDVTDVRPLELLLIDDDRLQLEMTAALLAGTPVSVVCCTHPDELFIHARQKRFDVIVTDIQMPAMSGIELISRLREVPELSALPVVAMTARSDMDSLLLAGHGFAACLHKPFTRKELLAVLADVTKEGNFDFGQMTSFAGDDKEGIACIMETFVSETRKKRDILERAMSDKDMSAVTVVTHQLLPVFVMLDARQGKEELEWFEARRDSVDYPPEAVEKIKLILGVVDNMIAEAECAL
jgi:CheY-like chemotaxis protein